MSQPQNAELPQINSTPVWNANEKIEMYGVEFEAIFNFINSINNAYMACSSILNRGVLNGTVRMKFEKLVNNEYVPMTEDEEKPYQDQFRQTVEQAKKLAEQATGLKENLIADPTGEKELVDVLNQSQENVPQLDKIVDQHGIPVNSPDKPNLTIVR